MAYVSMIFIRTTSLFLENVWLPNTFLVSSKAFHQGLAPCSILVPLLPKLHALLAFAMSVSRPLFLIYVLCRRAHPHLQSYPRWKCFLFFRDVEQSFRKSDASQPAKQARGAVTLQHQWILSSKSWRRLVLNDGVPQQHYGAIQNILANPPNEICGLAWYLLSSREV